MDERQGAFFEKIDNLEAEYGVVRQKIYDHKQPKFKQIQ